MCKSLFASRQVNREPLKVSQRTITQGTLVGGTQNHAGRLACFEDFFRRPPSYDSADPGRRPVLLLAFRQRGA
jgi:hypothetical protein